mmetsp:Transcript_86934/g.246368  ORF Transcript_86934/g.246368 Transcript_86934/m.246368 type:complete len:216 (-) Transcript_86934:2016-2663(-)
MRSLWKRVTSARHIRQPSMAIADMKRSEMFEPCASATIKLTMETSGSLSGYRWVSASSTIMKRSLSSLFCSSRWPAIFWSVISTADSARLVTVTCRILSSSSSSLRELPPMHTPPCSAYRPSRNMSSGCKLQASMPSTNVMTVRVLEHTVMCTVCHLPPLTVAWWCEPDIREPTAPFEPTTIMASSSSPCTLVCSRAWYLPEGGRLGIIISIRIV